METIIQKLKELKLLNHHMIEEEIWRIDEIIQMLQNQATIAKGLDDLKRDVYLVNVRRQIEREINHHGQFEKGIIKEILSSVAQTYGDWVSNALIQEYELTGLYLIQKVQGGQVYEIKKS
ncbi:MAG: hypothetical protein V3U54_08840 [Thermodesulfobacteriota bacterium]